MKTNLMTATVLSGLAALACIAPAHAQMTPQQQMQVPDSNPNSANYHTRHLPSIGAGDTVQRWEDRWGAFAMSPTSGWSGKVLNAKSKEAAERAALDECATRGGGVRDCEVSLVFYNQCGAVVAKDGRTTFAHAPTVEQARARAMKTCGGSECEVFFEGCSPPAQVTR